MCKRSCVFLTVEHCFARTLPTCIHRVLPVCSTRRGFDVRGFAHVVRKVDNQGISRREKVHRTRLLFPARSPEYSRYFTESWEIGYSARLIKHTGLLSSRRDTWPRRVCCTYANSRRTLQREVVSACT